MYNEIWMILPYFLGEFNNIAYICRKIGDIVEHIEFCDLNDVGNKESIQKAERRTIL